MASLNSRQYLWLGKCFLALVFAVLSLTSPEVSAAPRQWLVKGGEKLYGEFIEMTSTDMVRIMLKGGEEKEVDFDSLSAVDQKFVRSKIGGAKPASATVPNPGAKPDSADDSSEASTKVGAPSDDLGSLKAQAQRCQTPDEAAVIYEVFLTNNKLSQTARASAEQELVEWQRKAKSGVVRFGPKWCTLDEVRAAQIKAYYQIGQGLELVRLNQNELALEKLKEASRTDPEGIRADFIIATVYALGSTRFDEAAQHYKTCLKRDPINIAVLNNLALVEIKQSKYADAVLHFKAATKERYDERIAQNMGRMLDQAGKRKLVVPKDTTANLNRIYASNVVANRLVGAKPNQGWQYLVIPADPPPDGSVTTANVTDSTGDPVVAAGGSGFVVYPNYVLTTRQLAKNAKEFQVGSDEQSGKALNASLVATSDAFDLALLQCNGLNLPPLPLEIVKPTVETPVLVVSHQLSAGLSAPGSSVRGSIVANPHSSLDRLLIYNVDGGFGSVGGPVFNEAGKVVALHSKNLSILSRSYGGGVPSTAVALFLQKAIPTYTFGSQGEGSKSWKDLAEDAKKSSVSIFAMARTQDVGLAKRIGAEFLEDCSCCACKGFGTEDCGVRACKRGKVPSVHREPTYFDTIAGKQMYMESHIMIPCTQCGGRGVVRCSFCGGSGIDQDLRVRPASRLNRGFVMGENGANNAANAMGQK